MKQFHRSYSPIPFISHCGFSVKHTLYQHWVRYNWRFIQNSQNNLVAIFRSKKHFAYKGFSVGARKILISIFQNSIDSV